MWLMEAKSRIREVLKYSGTITQHMVNSKVVQGPQTKNWQIGRNVNAEFSHDGHRKNPSWKKNGLKTSFSKLKENSELFKSGQ
jgi:hypothetical protein